VLLRSYRPYLIFIIYGTLDIGVEVWKMGMCSICGRKHKIVSSWLGVCARCLKERPEEALKIVRERRREWRLRHGLPAEPPKGPGIPCKICVNECRIPEGERGYCGIWMNRKGRLEPIVGHNRIVGFTYLDPLPTNCVATPVCPAATGRGYPRFTDTLGPEIGYYNLAVFLGGCPLDCAFCQNPEHKFMIAWGKVSARYVMTVDELVEKALDPKVRCICYFGGDPAPQTPILVRVSKEIVRRARELGQRFKRICWETDGLENPWIMREMAKVSLESGGIVKIDWKAWTPSIYEALTGVDGRKAVERLKENTKVVSKLAAEREDPPLLVVSVLLVPGYVGPWEVYKIAEYLSGLDPKPPMVLLAFHPEHRMTDLPTTSIDHALKAIEAAKRAGIEEVYLGNEWLLSNSYIVEPWWDSIS
jgi:pyruvate formate lyase activating enzyme